MSPLGYAISSEEHRPADLISNARRAWAADEATARRTAKEWWPNLTVPGQLSQELPLPAHFDQAAKLVREEDMDMIPLGPDPERHLAGIRQFLDAGYDHVYVHQIGPDQEGFFRFYQREVMPKVG